MKHEHISIRNPKKSAFKLTICFKNLDYHCVKVCQSASFLDSSKEVVLHGFGKPGGDKHMRKHKGFKDVLVMPKLS